MRRIVWSRSGWVATLATLAVVAALSCSKETSVLAPFPETPGMVLAGTVRVDGAGAAVGVAVALEPVQATLPASVWRALDPAAAKSIAAARGVKGSRRSSAEPSAPSGPVETISQLAASVATTTAGRAERRSRKGRPQPSTRFSGVTMPC